MNKEENENDLDVGKEREKLDKIGVKGTWDLLEEKEESISDEKEEKKKPFT